MDSKMFAKEFLDFFKREGFLDGVYVNILTFPICKLTNYPNLCSLSPLHFSFDQAQKFLILWTC